MTTRYVWLTLDTASGALSAEGVFILRLQPSMSPTLKAFQESWTADTTVYNKSLHGSFNKTTKLPLYDPNGPLWDTDYADVGDGVPDVWGMLVYDTVFFLAAALQSMVRKMQDLSDGDLLLQSLKSTTIDGVTGELRLDSQTSDRAYLYDLVTMACPQSSVGCINPELVTVMAQNATSNSFIQVHPSMHWPAGFGNVLPDDGSLLEASKCMLSLTGGTFQGKQGMDLQINVVNNFGEAPSEAAQLTVSLSKSNGSEVLSTTEITIPENSSSIAVAYVTPEPTGAYEISVVDKRTGYPIQGSPRTFVVAGTRQFRHAFSSAKPQEHFVRDLLRYAV
jgi:hypothetical protein